MNNILHLKGKFQTRSNPIKPGPTNLKKNTSVTSAHINDLTRQLRSVLSFWQKDKTIGGALVSVHYIQVVAKSNRIKSLLSNGSKSPTLSIRGSKFEFDENGVPRHVFTHYVPLNVLEHSIADLEMCSGYVNSLFNGTITDEDIEKIHNGMFKELGKFKNIFIKLVVDSYFVDELKIDFHNELMSEDSIVTVYKTDVDARALLNKFGIETNRLNTLDDTTFHLNRDEINTLLNNVPYLIAMEVKNFTEISREYIVGDSLIENQTKPLIPHPSNEPIIGVLDTQFDETVYFNEWVDYKNMLTSDFEITSQDCFHGTAVSSLIVDGPTINPNLDDGCGRFRVRHFGVSMAKGFSSFTILKLIREIVSSNTDIKVWNLSLGSALQIDLNFISPEAAELDKIQNEYDVIFVIAGTNKPSSYVGDYRIGAPADSINSLVVNAVDFDGQLASYTRTGPVLSFFNKPDVCYYGGDGSQRIKICGPLGEEGVTGTSFAAPWIARKMAYLIHIMGLSREVAKALIIDSAAGWNRKDRDGVKMGYGIVPLRIEDIVHSNDDEIRFIMNGTIEEYETYAFNIPVPRVNDAYPFYARATVVYFPKCERSQGVDYTSTEMDVHFGRVVEEKGKVTVKSVNDNKQSEGGFHLIRESAARKFYRKWDNVKMISETIKTRAIPKKSYDNNMWGIKIVTKERLEEKAGKGMNFGVVVTLKEMNGVNRIDDFIRLCIARNWIVNSLDVQNQVDVYHMAEEEVEWD